MVIALHKPEGGLDGGRCIGGALICETGHIEMRLAKKRADMLAFGTVISCLGMQRRDRSANA